jgi:hypothetical protein
VLRCACKRDSVVGGWPAANGRSIKSHTSPTLRSQVLRGLNRPTYLKGSAIVRLIEPTGPKRHQVETP